jgi:sucrose-phosphate synthase
MYIQLISVHGLIRGQDVEWGRDADTGEQIRYVLELAKTLSRFEEVDAVDLFTRRIRDNRVSPDYGEELEWLGPNCRLIRVPCGGGRYIRKERLWPTLDEFVDGVVGFTRREKKMPTVVHGHYADAGYVAKEIAAVFDVPFVFAAHSLGRTKLASLLEDGWTREAADNEFNIEHRISVEQDCLAVADFVVTSTQHERDVQYREYHKDPNLRFEVIPPGTDLTRFFPYYEYDLPQSQVAERFKQAHVGIVRELERFHYSREKPLILAFCPPERRKNVGVLIEAYGQSKQLQAIANLAVFAGIRMDFETMPEDEQQVLADMLLAMDRYDLYGKMAIPKTYDSEYDLPELYRIAASRRGVFVNTDDTEAFGLTLIEASATGLPFVATENGGPQDIAENCESGILVDTNDRQALTDAMLKLLTDQILWDEFSNNGINFVPKHYSWETHCEDYLKCLSDAVRAPARTPSVVGRTAPGRRIAALDCVLITDIDNTLLGDDEALERLKELLHDNRERMGFGVASGRSLDLVTEALTRAGIHDIIDVIIASVGVEIYYGPDHVLDRGRAAQLRYKWRPDRVREALDPLPFVCLQQGPGTQREFKISYLVDKDIAEEEALRLIRESLARARAAHKLIFSHGEYLDILPHRASKGKAVRYLSGKWNIPLERIATAGDSGNDRDMLLGRTSGIVVGNYDRELETLRRSKAARVYFAQANCAGGIVEGLQHYEMIPAVNPVAV